VSLFAFSYAVVGYRRMSRPDRDLHGRNRATPRPFEVLDEAAVIARDAIVRGSDRRRQHEQNGRAP
jgi:hypothetical protein